MHSDEFAAFTGVAAVFHTGLFFAFSAALYTTWNRVLVERIPSLAEVRRISYPEALALSVVLWLMLRR